MNFYLVDLVHFCKVVFYSVSLEEFIFGSSTVYADPPGVSADPYLFGVSERHGKTCSLVCIHNNNNKYLLDKSRTVRII